MQVISGRIYKPFNIILIGTQGIGKSTWAANAPSPLFISGEENDEMSTSRLPQVSSFDEFKSQLDWVIKNKPKNETLVIDTIDSIEKLLHKKILSEDSKSGGSMSKAMGGYGKAYEAAEHAMIEIRESLKTIRDDLKMNIIILCHCKKVLISDTILGLQYDSYEMILHQKAQNVFCDWVSCIFFANYVAYQSKDSNSDKVFALGAGERVMFTEKRPGHIGKNRFGLPYELPLEFNEFYKRFKTFYESDQKITPSDLRTQILGLSENIKDDELRKKVLSSAEKSGDDFVKLERILKRVNELI